MLSMLGEVSILVFLELALGQFRGSQLFLQVQVSILVFLELALGPTAIQHSDAAALGFNPCFLGTCPRTHITGHG